ncbi:MAG: hypothetical protein ACTHOB_07180 [Ginsengibacter sp.]
MEAISMENEYSIDEHIHRYACWTAARAASISRFSNNEIGQFIFENNLQKELDNIKKGVITSDEYKRWFVMQTKGILESMKKYNGKTDQKLFRNISFGIAAKVVSIYVKTAEIIPSRGLSRISNIAIPPIDSYLLKGLKIKTKAWSTLNKEEYMKLVNEIEERNEGRPFWKLEYYWNLNVQ